MGKFSIRKALRAFSFSLLSIGTFIIVGLGVSNMPGAAHDSLRIALCQIFCLDGDRAGNLTRIEHALEEAKEKEVHLACFPETAIYGWVNPEAHERADSIPGKDSKALCALAKKYEMYVCVGLAEKEGDHLYDSVILINDKGEILLKHRKMNILSHLMDPPYTPGNKIQAVDTDIGTIGLLICADTFVGEYLEQMKELQPDLVLVPYGWAEQEEAWPQHAQSLHNTVSSAAKVIGAPVMGTDLVGEITHGPWRGYVYGGQSVAVDNKGEILAVGKDRDRHIVFLSISKK